MKIAFLTELYAPSVGGVESRVKAWAEELARQGHECEVWCIGHSTELPDQEVLNGVTVRRLVSHSQYKGTGIARRHWPTVLRFCGKLWLCRRLLSSFDGIILGKWPLLHALIVSYPRNVNVMMDWCELRSGSIWQLIYRLLVARKRYSHIAINSGIANWLSLRGVPRERVLTIGSASNSPVSAQRVTRVDKRILFFGRMSEHKQPLLLMQAFIFGRLAECGYSLHFAGDGPLLEALKELAANVAGVVLHGRVTDEEKVELLASASILALPSLREGFPVVVSEACTVGTPTLTIRSADNGTEYIVRELRCGWVVGGTIHELASAMKRYSMTDSSEWKVASMEAVARSSDTLSIESQTREIVDAFR